MLIEMFNDEMAMAEAIFKATYLEDKVEVGRGGNTSQYATFNWDDVGKEDKPRGRMEVISDQDDSKSAMERVS